MSIRILIVDDHAYIRRALIDLLADFPDIQVVGECSDGGQVVSAVALTQADVVLMDLQMPHVDGLQATRELSAAHPRVRVVVLTGDIHLAGIGQLPGVGTEFVAASISSSGLDPGLQPVVAGFPAVVDAELAHRGYIRHVVTPEAWTAEYRTVDDVALPDSPVSTWRTFRVDAATPDQPVVM